MSESPADTRLEHLVHKAAPHSKLLRAWQLKGGVSARITALEIVRPDGQAGKMVVRQYGDTDLQQNPHVAAHELKLLHLLQSVGCPAPKPYYVDQSGEIFTTPYIVTEYVEGQPEFAPANVSDLILQLAAQLYRIHRIDASHPDLSFLPLQEQVYGKRVTERPPKLDESLDEPRIRTALESVWPLRRQNPSVLLHGDYWPGNILWREGQLVAVIDWEDAHAGDPLADLANSRLEILWAYGLDAMNAFTRHYQSMATIDFTNLPYWDLCAALRPAFKIEDWAAAAVIEARMRERHKWFVTQAFEELCL